MTNQLTSKRFRKSPAERTTGRRKQKEGEPTQSPLWMKKREAGLEPKWKGLPNPRAPCSARTGTKGVQDTEEGCPRSGRGRPCGLCAFLASGAQVKPLPSRALTLPTLFRNRVPETGRAAGREARSVPASFPFESPCGISFRTVRKSEREPVGCSAAPGRLPHRAALGRRSRRARGGAGGPGASPTGWG